MKYVIVGGTGTLGQALIESLTDGEITCLSRDELKQQDLKKKYPHVKFVIADIRDKNSLRAAFIGADTIFHVAALKHVDVLEKNPVEAIKTNILGTINVAETAIELGVPNVVFSSTDKAVLPINVYGMTKAISERYLFNLNETQSTTRFAVYRWANVIGSRGSVLHSFAKSLRESGKVSITDARMTRFWIRIQDAVWFMLNTYKIASKSEVMIPPMKATSITRLASALASAIGVDKYEVTYQGIRPGEKIHECIFSSHDKCIRSDNSPQYEDEEIYEILRALSL